MLEGSEESSDSGCEADSLLPPETEEGDAARKRQQRRAEENGPFSLDKALGFVDFDSNDFDEVRENKSLFFFIFVSHFLFFLLLLPCFCVYEEALLLVLLFFFLPSSALPTPLLSCWPSWASSIDVGP